MSGETPQAHHGHSLVNRLHFLYKVIEDTQATIRFLDTKAAFCVTLVSGMAAVGLQRPHAVESAHRVLLSAFLGMVILTLLVCLRVIFPTIRPSGSLGNSVGPKFYVGHNKAHHWILHTIAHPVDDILSEDHASYIAAMEAATDDRLLASLSDTVLMTAVIRQVKSDRLHAALFCLVVSVVFFAALVLV